MSKYLSVPTFTANPDSPKTCGALAATPLSRHQKFNQLKPMENRACTRSLPQPYSH
jgi:hypothetical protein